MNVYLSNDNGVPSYYDWSASDDNSKRNETPNGVGIGCEMICSIIGRNHGGGSD
jgi:hypothetical protein